MDVDLINIYVIIILINYLPRNQSKLGRRPTRSNKYIISQIQIKLKTSAIKLGKKKEKTIK